MKDEFDDVFQKGYVYIVPENIDSSVTFTKKVKLKSGILKPNTSEATIASEEEPPQASETNFTYTSRHLVNPSDINNKTEHILWEEKKRLAKIVPKCHADDCEFWVLELLRNTLKECMTSDDMPALVRHNVSLGGKEKDAIVLHHRLGVIVVEVKAAANKDAFSTLVKANKQVLSAREQLQSDLEEFLHPDAVTTVIALPNMKEEDIEEVKSHIQDRKDTEFLCGLELKTYVAWVRMRLEKVSKGAFKGATEDQMEESFKKCWMRLSCGRESSLGQGVKELATKASQWVLTSEQLEVRNVKDEVVHITGPPGAGKSLLLIDRARQWLRQGRTVYIVTGQFMHNILLTHLKEEILQSNKNVTEDARKSGPAAASVCPAEDKAGADRQTLEVFPISVQMTTALQRRAMTEPDLEPVSVIFDEVQIGSFEYTFLLNNRQSLNIQGLWSAHMDKVSEEMTENLSKDGCKVYPLIRSLRCPAHVIELANKVRKPEMPEIPAMPLYKPVRVVGLEPKIVLHARHGNDPFYKCRHCKDDLGDFCHSLGLPFGENTIATGHLSYSDTIAIVTGGLIHDLVETTKNLREMGLPAVRESTKLLRGDPGFCKKVKPEKHHDECIKNSRHVISGTALYRTKDGSRTTWIKPADIQSTDKQGERLYTERPVMHVVSLEEFRGMERPVVLLIHDNGKAVATATDHHRELFEAITRCQGNIMILDKTSESAPCALLESLQRLSI